MKTRMIEMYVGQAWSGGVSGEWWTVFIDIPVDTPDDQVESRACEEMRNQLMAEGTDFVFVGVYGDPEQENEDA